jgi:TolB-like protein/DNA-binding winged helix-turn-helix (wHTH) protein/Tfp pilus assembly protein PilF
MGEAATVPRVVRFGVFEVDLRAGELRKKGVKVRLQEQPLQVLATLLERPGELVTREELKHKLWAGTVVDFDHSINTTINKLREALGDSADSPRFIETLPRRGYRFIYPVNGAASLDAPVDGAPAEMPALPVDSGGAPTAAADNLEDTTKARGPARPGHRRMVAIALGALLATLLAAFALDVAGLRGRLTAHSAQGQINSVAVLPLKNLSGEPQQDYFADGVTQALVTELGKIGALHVVSYQSVVGYRQTTKPLPQIARELNVDAIVEGAVLHTGQRVRITANLVQASPERHLWAESYEFDLQDVVAVQAEVARDVARSIRANVTSWERERLAPSRRVDSDAYEAYLLARAHLSKPPSEESWLRAKEYLEKAVDKDPGYAPAYAALAELYGRQPRSGAMTRSPNENRLKIRKWAEKALELDDTLAEPHTILARLAQQQWDWTAAEREYHRAIELNPNYPVARIWHAMFLYAVQRFEEAAAEARRAQRVDPASPLVNTWAGTAYFLVGRVEDAMASWQRALELDPAFPDASLALGRAYMTQGKFESAIAQLQKAVALNHHQPMLVGALAHVHARAGHRDEALKLVSELARIEKEKVGYVSPFGMIWAYAGLADNDQAFAWLEKAYEERYDRMVWLNVDPLLDPLRADARFSNLVRRVGLPMPGSARPR